MRQAIILMAIMGIGHVSGLSQSNITGQAPITLVDGGTACLGSWRIVDVMADVTGMSGDGGDVGINAFVVSVEIGFGYGYDVIFAGDSPQPFTIQYTHPFIGLGSPIIVGYNANPNAPNSLYHLARIWVKGQVGDFTVGINALESSLGSRVVGGFGPGAIPYTTVSPSLFSIDAEFTLQLDPGVGSWLMIDGTYDIASPPGEIDVRDLIMLVNCRLTT